MSMSTGRRARLFALMLLSAVLGAAAVLIATMFRGTPTPSVWGHAELPGEFVALVDLPPQLRERLTLNVYEDFTCPACQRLEAEGFASIRTRFGDRVTVLKHYLAGPATPKAAKILYDLAADHGNGEDVAKALFAAKLQHGDDEANLPVVKAIAGRFGLERAYASAIQGTQARARIKAEWKEKGDRVAFFPFVVIEDEIAVNGDVDNLIAILDSLLTRGHDPST